MLDLRKDRVQVTHVAAIFASGRLLCRRPMEELPGATALAGGTWNGEEVGVGSMFNFRVKKLQNRIQLESVD